MSNFAFSDLHGNLNAWRAIQAQTGPDDCLYCLGDAADKGPDGYLMLREILADPRVTYLKGNHDDMFVKWNIEDNLTRSLHWRHHCGGKPTYDAWKADGKPSDILIKLWHAPIHQMLVTEKGLILLSHAGYTPRQNCLRSLSDDDLLRGRKHFTSAALFLGNQEEGPPESTLIILL